MKGICLQIYVNELTKHHGKPLYEWLLEKAKKEKIPGGSAFRGIAGYGHSGVMHEAHFFELGSNVPVEVKFFLSKEAAYAFLNLLKKENLELFHVLIETEIVF